MKKSRLVVISIVVITIIAVSVMLNTPSNSDVSYISLQEVDQTKLGIEDKYNHIQNRIVADDDGIYINTIWRENLVTDGSTITKLNKDFEMEWNLNSFDYGSGLSIENLTVIDNQTVAVSLDSKIYVLNSDTGMVNREIDCQFYINDLFFSNGRLFVTKRDSSENTQLYEIDAKSNKPKLISSHDSDYFINDIYCIDDNLTLVLYADNHLDLIDNQGNILKSKTYSDPNNLIDINSIEPSIVNPEHLILVSGYQVIEIDQNGEVIQEKTVTDGYITDFRAYDQGYLVAIDSQIFKLDEAGKVVEQYAITELIDQLKLPSGDYMCISVFPDNEQFIFYLADYSGDEYLVQFELENMD